MNFITSLSNSKIKQVVKLANSKIYRYDIGLAVIYGKHLVLEAIKYSMLHSVFINHNKADEYADLVQNINGDNIHIVNNDVFAKINLSDTITDIIGLIQIKIGGLDNNVYEKDCVILDNIQDPGNLGTIMRSCTAAGINNILLSKSCVDPYNTKVLRASQGIQFRLNIITAVDIIKFINCYKYEVIATMPNAADNIYTHDLTKPCAWLFGNEGSGIPRLIVERTAYQLAIPMQGDSESLNVAMAATICLFEMLRQRSFFNIASLNV